MIGWGRWGRRIVWLVAVGVAPVVAFIVADRVFPFPFERLERPGAQVVSDRDGVPLRLFLAEDERWRLPVSLSELPAELVEVVVASEDRWFFRHPGVNPAAIVRAAWSNFRAGRVVSGGSTISMQLARMADPAPRTLAAKLRESFRALQIELRLGKEEILERYLNLAPYGGNLEGVGAASYFYFGKVPSQLALGEVALLAVLPRAPVAYDPTRNPAAARAVRDRLLAQLERRGLVTAAAAASARRHPLPDRRRAVPFDAPHLARLARRLRPDVARVATTLDRQVQHSAERMVERRVASLVAEGLSEAAVVVIENDSRALRAMVGSPGFFRGSAGQVNGTLARRSPGSTLKPLLYGLALDGGRILPESYLLDLPTDFGGYVAENYDGLYHGRVTARQALVESLNAPAVRLLSRVGLGPFLGLLKEGGLESLDRPPAEYGLPLVLGGGEVTLLELTNLYASLAAGGVHHRPRLFADQDLPRASNGRRLLSAEATWLLTEILTEVERPDLPRTWDLTRGAPEVAWKTGTSYGHRDAWAVGFSRRYTIGVWVGNFDGRARQGISGSVHAAPLLFDLFRAVEPGGVAPREPAGLRIDRIEVCALSHELPGPYCPRRASVAYLPGRSRLATCPLHHRMAVDAATGEHLPGRCRAGREVRWRSVTRFPSELVAWWRAEGEPFEELPRLPDDCPAIPTEAPPRILSPDATTPYRVRREAPLEFQQIPLKARAAAETRRLYWYQDGALVASGGPGESLFLTPRRGSHRLVVTDDAGRSDTLTYRVE